MKFNSPIVRFFLLTRIEKTMFAEALFLFILVRIITFFPMRYYKNWVTSVPRTKTITDKDQRIFILKKTISRIRRYFLPDATCLVKAIVAKKILSKHGISSTLYIGVKKEEKRLMAHAWLKQNEDFVVDGTDVNDYTIMTTL